MKEYKINNEIKASEVILIDAEGNKVGLVGIKKAYALAYEAEMDLVLINENSKPMVCKLMDYSKFLYDQKKKEKEMKRNSTKIESAEVRITYRIQQHDLETKANMIKRLLEKNDEVKITLRMKGREVTHSNMAFDVINKLIELCSEFASIKKNAYKDNYEIRAILIKK